MAQVLSDRDGRIRAASSKRTMEETPDKGEERVYTQEAVDKRATFLHGTEEQFLNRWVYEYLKYPESAIRNGVEGKVVAEFVVDAKGKVRDVEIVKGVVTARDGKVVDAPLREAVEKAMAQIRAAGIDCAVLQSRSPTCGVNQIYDGTFTGTRISGSGIFAQALKDAGYRVIDAEDLPK